MTDRASPELHIVKQKILLNIKLGLQNCVMPCINNNSHELTFGMSLMLSYLCCSFWGEEYVSLLPEIFF